MKPQSAKNKGRILQKWVRDKIRSVFDLEDADVTSRSMGASGTDVLLSPKAKEKIPASIECKNQQSLNLWKSWDQAVINVDPGTFPLLIVKRNNTIPLAILSAELLFELISEAGKT